MSKWNAMQLSEFIQFKNGKKRPAGTGSIPVYGGNGVLDYADTSNQENSIVIGRVGAYCGSVYYEPCHHWVSDNAISAINKSNSDIVYDYYLLKSLNLNHRHIGTSQPLLTQEILNSIIVDLPSLPTQRTIAAILSSLDDKIANNNAINHNLEQMAQTIFKSWFVDFEPSKPFTEVVQVLGGGTPKTTTAEFWDGSIPFFTPKDTQGLYVLSTEKNLTEEGLNNCNSRLYPQSTVFVTARGTVGKLAIAGVPMAMNQSCYALIGNGGYGQHFVYNLALEVTEHLKHKASGAVFDAIVTRDFESEIVAAPPIEAVNEFENTVKPIYETILTNVNESDRLADLRDTLLPRLMSGELMPSGGLHEN